MPEYFYCANRYAKQLTSEYKTFRELAEQFAIPTISTLKDSTGIFPGHYTQPHRQLQYIDFHNLLAIDIDNHEQSELLIARINSRDAYLYTFNFIVYSTFSSTDKSLRLRLLIEVDTSNTDDHNSNDFISIDDYPAATRTIENNLKLKVDQASHKRNSFVYIPNIQPKSGYMYYRNINGRAFEKRDIHQEFYSTKSTPQSDFHEFVNQTERSFISTYNSEDIPDHILIAMLDAIDPDCNYETWMRVIAGIHHYSGGAKWGFDLINNWSAKGRKYEGPDDLWYKWESIKDDKENLVTIGSVIFIANKFDWYNKYSSNISVNFRKEIAENKEKFNKREFIDEFSKRVSKHKFDSFTLDEIVFDIVGAVCEVRDVKRSEQKSKILKYVRTRCQFGGRPSERTDEERVALTPTWLKEWAVVHGMSTDSMFVNVRRPMSEMSGVILYTAKKFNEINKKRAPEPGYDLAHDAVHVHEIPIVEAVKFAPQEPTIFRLSDGSFCLNSFINDESFYFTQTTSEYQLQLIYHLERFFGYFLPDEKERRIFLNFLAYCVFHFGSKVNWAPLIITTEGYGKDTVMHLLEIALGKYRRHYLKLSGHTFFDNKWTALQEHRAFVYVNEILAYDSGSRDNSLALYNRIKDSITETRGLIISQKYQVDRRVDQVTNYCFSSNFYNAITFPDTERRLFILWPERHHSNVIEAKDRVSESIDFIWEAINASGVGERHFRTDPITQQVVRHGILKFFHKYSQQENIDSDFKPLKHAYKTEEFYEMTSNINADYKEIILELIEDPDFAYATKDYVCATPVLYETTSICKQRHITQSVRLAQIKSFLLDLGYKNAVDLTGHEFRPDITHTIPGPYKNKTQFYVAPSLFKRIRETNQTATNFLATLYEEYAKWVKQEEFIEYGEEPLDDGGNSGEEELLH